MKYEKEKEKEKNKFLIRILEKKDNQYKLKPIKKGSFFYHLMLVDMLKEAVESDNIDFQHFAFLRQLLETLSSFLGKPRFSYALEKLEVKDPSLKTDIINARSHEFYNQKASFLDEPDKEVIIEVMKAIDNKFAFV